MSWRSAEQSSSSRSSYSSSRASRSAAAWVATACRRKRSGIRSQPGVRSKKSKVAARAARVSTPSGERTSIASGMLAILPFLRWELRFPMRRTVITRATSDSTAATTSPTDVRSSRTTRRTRSRDSARAGKASRASKAAVRRRPWPSPCGETAGSKPAAVVVAAAGMWRHPGYRQRRHESLRPASQRAGGLLQARNRSGRASRRGPRQRPTRRSPGRPWFRRSPGAPAGRRPWAWRRSARPARAAPARPSPRRTARPRSSASRAARRRSTAPSRMTFSQAFGSKSRRSTRKPASGQKSASVCSLSWLIATASMRQLATGELLEARLQVLNWQLAQVAPVHPAQLLLVEHGRVPRHAREVEVLDQLVGREEGRRLVVAPAEQRDVVAHGLGQVAGGAQLLDRGCAVALGELLAVGPVQQREVRVGGRLRAQRPQDHHLPRGVGDVVLAAHDLGDAHVAVVDGDGEVVERAAVRAADHEVLDRLVGGGDVAADLVVDDRLALVGHAQAHGAVVLVGVTARQQLLDRLGVRGARSACEIGPSSQSSSSQRSASRICSTFSGVERSRSVSSIRSTNWPP